METIRYAWTSCFLNCKKVHFVNLSFSLSWITQDFLDHSPWFEYKSTPFWSAHVCGTSVLCYHDSDLIVGAFCEWGDGWFAILSHNVHAHNACVAMVKSCDKSVAPRATASIVSARDEAQDHENLLFSERILKASKFTVGSSFSEPGNEDSH